MDGPFKIHLTWGDDFENSVAVHMLQRVDGKPFIADYIKWVSISEGAAYTAPVGYMSRDDAQHLMDRLWDIGLRPRGAKGTQGQLEAVQFHLQDMRDLSQRLLDSFFEMEKPMIILSGVEK